MSPGPDVTLRKSDINGVFDLTMDCGYPPSGE